MNEDKNKDMESFNNAAAGYDSSRRDERAEIIANEFRSHIADTLNKDAIEYGCGIGLVGLRLAGEFRSLLMVDYSAGMLRQAEEKIKQMKLKNVSTLHADFLTEAPAGLGADYIFTSLALHHVKDTEAILRVFYNLLRQGGKLLIADINHGGDDFHAKYPDFDGHPGFKQKALMETACKIGFVNPETKTFYTGEKEADGEIISYSLFCMTLQCLERV